MSHSQAVQSEVIENGKVVVFSRPSSRTQNFYYEFQYPGTRGEKERRSTGTSDLEAAKEIASARYRKVCILVEEGYSVHMPTVEDLCRHYLAFWDRLLEAGEVVPGTHKSLSLSLENYIIPFFGKTPVIKLTQRQIDTYPAWRREERVRKAGEARRNNNVIEVPYKTFDKERQEYVYKTKEMPFNIWAQRMPTDKSIRREVMNLVRAINHGVETRQIKPSEKPFIWQPARKRARRGYFNDTGNPGDPANTYHRLWTALLENFLNDKTTNGKKRAIHHKFMAEQVYYWAQLMDLSGVPTNEMMSLTHGNVHLDLDKDLIFTIKPKLGEKRNKRRHRQAVCDPSAFLFWQEYLEFRRIWFVERLGFPEIPSQDEPLWLNWHGQPETRYIQQRFQVVLRRANLLMDQDGNNLSAYSLRHTYCVRELKRNTSVYTLALNMGTSVDSIERYYGPIIDAVAMKALNRRKAHLGNQQIQRLSDQQRAKQVKPFVKQGDRH